MTSEPRTTVLSMSRSDRLATFIVLPTLGVLAAVLLPPLARWALSLERGLPFRPLFWAVGAVDRPWRLAVAVALGALAGLALAASAHRSATTVTLTDDAVRLDVEGWTATVARRDIAAVFLDKDRLVLLAADCRHLAREPVASNRTATAEAFVSHGYPWREADPHAHRYRAFDGASADVPAEVGAILIARQKALRGKDTTQARELRIAAQRLGFEVREDGTTQFWRGIG
ncbi:YqeB family protein [Luedemannella flava]|uniref:YqeB family protein n=1 Tax=Luedemannella flava TaxID=349316 RepID=UPI0031DA1694